MRNLLLKYEAAICAGVFIGLTVSLVHLLTIW